jgi:hypothetical protein
MKKETLLEICSNHKLEIETNITPYGRGMIVSLDDNKLDSNNKEKKHKELIDWSYDLHDIVIEWDNLDGFSCLIKNENQELIFKFYYNESWKYNGIYGDKEIKAEHLLPHLPEFINQFKQYQNLQLKEDEVYCCFTFDNNSSPEIEIHDLWSEGSVEMSFNQNIDLIEKLKVEIEKRINQTFHEHHKLWINSENGIDIDIDIPHEEEYTYEELFD